MNNFTIETEQDYNDLCDYIEKDQPPIVEIGTNYFTTDKEHFNLSNDYLFVIEDITEYAINGLPEPAVIDMSHVKLTSEDIQRDHTLLKAKGRIIETSETELNLKPIGHLVVDNIKWSIF